VALSWCREQGHLELGLELCSALRRYWSARASYRQGLEATAAFLEHPGASELEPRARRRGGTGHGLLALLLGDYATAERSLRQSLALQDAAAPLETAEILCHLSWALLHGGGNQAEGEELAQRALRLYREQGEARGEAVALNNLAWAALFRDAPREAGELGRRSLEQRRVAADRGLASCVRAAWRHGLGDTTPDRTRAELVAAAQRLREVGGDGLAWSLSLYLRGLLELEEGSPEAALEPLQEAHDQWRRLGSRWPARQAAAALERLAGPHGAGPPVTRPRAES
jgi:tetratricopeptide (TPR) repeat protein